MRDDSPIRNTFFFCGIAKCVFVVLNQWNAVHVRINMQRNHDILIIYS